MKHERIILKMANKNFRYFIYTLQFIRSDLFKPPMDAAISHLLEVFDQKKREKQSGKNLILKNFLSGFHQPTFRAMV